ncbi:MAG: Hpt domain-containing protein [Rhodocyclaceae bacterium]|nr:Hpt domain-containing protein [Rhodocyclaceae bacterium]
MPGHSACGAQPRGGAGYFEANELKALCQEIEVLADAGALDAIRSTLPMLQSAIDAACASLRQENNGANAAD